MKSKRQRSEAGRRGYHGKLQVKFLGIPREHLQVVVFRRRILWYYEVLHRDGTQMLFSGGHRRRAGALKAAVQTAIALNCSIIIKEEP